MKSLPGAGVYQQVKTQLENCGIASLALTTSFRAVPSIQRLVNRAFAPLMSRRGGQGTEAGYVPLSPRRAEVDDQPSIVVLPVPRPYVCAESRRRPSSGRFRTPSGRS